MAKSHYKLNNYYDAQRAVQRKIYIEEIKGLSSTLKKLGFYNDNIYSMAIKKVNEGIYQNMGDFYPFTHNGNDKSLYIGNHKNARNQDFMSPLELRLNSIAVGIAKQNLINSNYNNLETIFNVCYLAGQTAASSMGILKQGKGVFNLKIDGEIKNCSAIVKKFDKALILNSVPRSIKVTYKDIRQNERNTLIAKNKYEYTLLHQKLIKLGVYDEGLRNDLIKSLNCGYYFIDDLTLNKNLEMAGLLFTKNCEKEEFRHTELAMNLEKLSVANKVLDSTKNMNINNLKKRLYTIGTKTREFLIKEHNVFPELFSGFYYSYCYAKKDNAIVMDTTNKVNKIKKKSKDKNNNINKLSENKYFFVLPDLYK